MPFLPRSSPPRTLSTPPGSRPVKGLRVRKRPPPSPPLTGRSSGGTAFSSIGWRRSRARPRPGSRVPGWRPQGPCRAEARQASRSQRPGRRVPSGEHQRSLSPERRSRAMAARIAESFGRDAKARISGASPPAWGVRRRTHSSGWARRKESTSDMGVTPLWLGTEHAGIWAHGQVREGNASVRLPSGKCSVGAVGRKAGRRKRRGGVRRLDHEPVGVKRARGRELQRGAARAAASEREIVSVAAPDLHGDAADRRQDRPRKSAHSPTTPLRDERKGPRCVRDLRQEIRALIESSAEPAARCRGCHDDPVGMDACPVDRRRTTPAVINVSLRETGHHRAHDTLRENAQLKKNHEINTAIMPKSQHHVTATNHQGRTPGPRQPSHLNHHHALRTTHTLSTTIISSVTPISLYHYNIQPTHYSSLFHCLLIHSLTTNQYLPSTNLPSFRSDFSIDKVVEEVLSRIDIAPKTARKPAPQAR